MTKPNRACSTRRHSRPVSRAVQLLAAALAVAPCLTSALAVRAQVAAAPATAKPPQSPTSAPASGVSTASPEALVEPQPPPQPSRADPAASELERHALQLYRERRYAEAVEAASQASKAYPEHAGLYAAIGLARTAMQQYASAVAAFERARELGELGPYHVLALARAYHGIRAYAKAEATLKAAQAAHDADPNGEHASDPLYYVLLGDAYGAFPTHAWDARQAYLRALELDPRNETARIALRRHQVSLQATGHESPRLIDSEPKPDGPPHSAILVNPISAVAGAATGVYSVGVEVQVAGRRVAFDAVPQFAFAGDVTGSGLSAFGFGMLVGTRAALSGEYLEGTFVLPRVGPLYWQGSGWDFVAVATELEVGYTWATAHGARVSPMLQAGLGVRAMFPVTEAVTTPGVGRANLEPTVMAMLDLSVGVGWL